MTMRSILRAMAWRLAEAGPAGALHLTVVVEGERRVVPLLWQGPGRGTKGLYDLALVQPPEAPAPVLVLRVPRGYWVLCLEDEAARKGLALTRAQAEAAAAGAAWREAVAAERRASGVRPWRPRGR